MTLYALVALALLASVVLGGLLGRLWDQRERREAEKKWRERDRLLDRRGAVASPPEVAHAGGNIKLTLRVTLTRTRAERLTTRAVSEGKTLDALVAEILEAAPTGPDLVNPPG